MTSSVYLLSAISSSFFWRFQKTIHICRQHVTNRIIKATAKNIISANKTYFPRRYKSSVLVIGLVRLRSSRAVLVIFAASSDVRDDMIADWSFESGTWPMGWMFDCIVFELIRKNGPYIEDCISLIINFTSSLRMKILSKSSILLE